MISNHVLKGGGGGTKFIYCIIGWELSYLARAWTGGRRHSSRMLASLRSHFLFKCERGIPLTRGEMGAKGTSARRVSCICLYVQLFLTYVCICGSYLMLVIFGLFHLKRISLFFSEHKIKAFLYFRYPQIFFPIFSPKI